MSTSLEILRKLSVLHAPEGKPFILKSGKESMTYVDVRLTALDPVGLEALAKDLFWQVHPFKPTYVAGVVVGGCPLATGVSLFSRDLLSEPLKALYVRAAAKDHGTGKLIEGSFRTGDSVALLEDVVTSGGSSLKAVETLRNAGLRVSAVVAVLDREEGGRAAIEGSGVPFRALFTLKELLSSEPV